MDYQTVKVQGSPVIMGTISCLADTTRFLEDRVKMHERQLRFLESATETMVQKHGEQPIPYFRVEQGWNDERRKRLSTTLSLTSITYDRPIPPGAARNQLLKILYESDADWLICMDDDHAIYEKYDGYKLMWEIKYPQFKHFLEKKYIVTSFPSYWDAYTAEVNAWGRQDTHWLFKKSRHPGNMPFAFIPNIVKYGHDPIWFNDESPAAKAGDIPEDLKFMIDWIYKGGRFFEVIDMLSKTCGDLAKSSIFEDGDGRAEKYAADALWATSYLKQKYPRNPALWTRQNFVRRKNPKMTFEIARQYPIKQEV